MTGQWALVITFMDEANDMFLELGAAIFKTKRERDAHLRSIPLGPDSSPYILDIESARGIEDDRLISAETAQRLTGKPIMELITEARQREAQPWR